MVKTPLRDYQKDIVDSIEISNENAMVVLATGKGKTLIAASLAESVLRRDPHSLVLFLVPTRALVKQQGQYLSQEIGVQVALYLGRDATICP